ncbi:hypothetical protein RYX36_016571 [Vicia faba]
MRTINAFECWPFPDREELNQHKIKSMLPPMAVPKRSRSHRRRRSKHLNFLDRSNICFTDVGGTSAPRENLFIRSNWRPHKIEDIIDRKKGKEKCFPNPTPPQLVVPLPPPPPSPPIPTYPSMPPPPPRPPKTQLLSPSLSQVENMLTVFVLDDEEEEDPQMVSEFRKSMKRYNVEPPKLNEGSLTLEEEKEELEINSHVIDAETTKELQPRLPMKRSLNKNLMMASKINFAVNREHNLKIKIKEKDEELIASKEETAKLELQNPGINGSKMLKGRTLKPNADMIGKSRFFPKKDKMGVRNNNVELNFNGMSNIKMNQADKSSKRGSCNGLPVNQENVVVVKQELFDPIVRDPFIQQNKQDKVSPKESPGVISQSSSLPIISVKGRDVSTSRSNKEKEKQHVMVRDFPVREESKRRNYKLEPYSSSQLQISSEKVFRPRNFPSNPVMKNPNAAFLHSHHVSANQSLGDSRNAGSNFPEKFRARTNLEGLVFQPPLSNAEMNDRKRGYHDASSTLMLPFSSPPSTWLSSSTSTSTSTRERLFRPTSSNGFHQNTWNLNFNASSSIHSTKAMYPPNFVKNANVCHVPIVHPTPIVNQPSAIKSSHHTFSKTRKRRAVEIIDFTNPHKLPNVGASSESNTGEAETDTSDVARSHLGVDPNVQVRALP